MLGLNHSPVMTSWVSFHLVILSFQSPLRLLACVARELRVVFLEVFWNGVCEWNKRRGGTSLKVVQDRKRAHRNLAWFSNESNQLLWVTIPSADRNLTVTRNLFCFCLSLTIATIHQIGPDDVFLREAKDAKPATSHAGVHDHSRICHQGRALIETHPVHRNGISLYLPSRILLYLSWSGVLSPAPGHQPPPHTHIPFYPCSKQTWLKSMLCLWLAKSGVLCFAH